jgi:hypothetical protein
MTEEVPQMVSVIAHRPVYDTWICGSRSITHFNDAEYDKLRIAYYLSRTIRTGGTKGVDQMAESHIVWLQAQKLKNNEGKIPELLPQLLPNYARYRGGTPLVRNKEGIDAATLVVAIWDGKSPGTKHCIDYTKELINKGVNKALFIVNRLEEENHHE